MMVRKVDMHMNDESEPEKSTHWVGCILRNLGFLRLIEVNGT